MIEVWQMGRRTVYRVTQAHKVDSGDVSSIMTDDNRLTLYTCAGSFDEKRHIVTATPI
jgi:sortase (surface protein transpeptidase)